jgi:hypothetical protein
MRVEWAAREPMAGLEMNLVDNERAKLTANWLNTLSAGTIIAGCVTPLVAIAYGLRPGAEPLSDRFILTLVIAWILIGVALHFGARISLGRLKE